MKTEQLSRLDIKRWSSEFFNLSVLRGKTDEGQSEMDRWIERKKKDQ